MVKLLKIIGYRKLLGKTESYAPKHIPNKSVHNSEPVTQSETRKTYIPKFLL